MTQYPQLSMQFIGFNPDGPPVSYAFSSQTKGYGTFSSFETMPLVDRVVLKALCKKIAQEIQEYEDGLGSRNSG